MLDTLPIIPPIAIPMEDPLVHTDEHPFCSDPQCPDKEDETLISELAQKVRDGLLTPEEADRTYRGEQL